MPAQCAECGGPTVWDDAASSEICTSCGTLADPAQVLLTSQDWHTESGLHTHQLGLRNPAAPTILKTRSNHTLAGQGQGLRDQKNALTMANFIKSLAVSMNAPGLTPRATMLFNQAKAVGYFRWGTRAKTVAGACLSLALREASRPDSIHDIATLLRCSPHLLARTFISLAAALKITTLTVDPSVYIATLQSYLSSILEEGDQVDSDIPSPLLKSLRPLPLFAVSNTARSLGRTLSRSCPSPSDDQNKSTKTTTKSSAASTACAIFMLSLEAENRDTLGSIGDLAKCLGARCHIGKGVVMAQYKAIQDQLAQLIEKVPWLEGYRQKGGRAKVSKRLVVARGLKDVIRFSEEIIQNTLLPDVELELNSEDGEYDWDEDYEFGAAEDLGAHITVDATNNGDDNVEPEPDTCEAADADAQTSNDGRPPYKRRKIHHSLDEASRFLLNPFSSTTGTTAPSSSLTISASTSSSTKSQSKPPPRPTSSTTSKFPLTSYVLSTSSLSSAVGHREPTRLQLLAAARGGSGEDAIRDEELFAEGELENMLRKEEEIAVMMRIFGWGVESEEEEGGKAVETKRKRGGGKRKRGGAVEEGQEETRKSRVNFEAFAKFMQGGEGEGADNDDVDGEGDTDHEDGAEFGFSLLGLDGTLGLAEDDDNAEDEPAALTIIEDQDCNPSRPSRNTNAHHKNDMEEIVIELDEWRPASPSGGGGACFENRYEEEYD